MNNQTKTSYSQTLLRELLALILVETPVENFRPSWMNGMELDLYFPRSRLAFEFQGDQHFEAGIFGDAAELKRQRARDDMKIKICRGMKIDLRQIIARELTVNSLWGKLSWNRKILCRLRQHGLIRSLADAHRMGAQKIQEAKRHRAHLRTAFDSATTFRGIGRTNALIRHASRNRASSLP